MFYRVGILKDVLSSAATLLGSTMMPCWRVVDEKPPRVEEVRLTGPQHIEITFSEPIRDKGIVKIDGENTHVY